MIFYVGTYGDYDDDDDDVMNMKMKNVMDDLNNSFYCFQFNEELLGIIDEKRTKKCFQINVNRTTPLHR